MKKTIYILANSFLCFLFWLFQYITSNNYHLFVLVESIEIILISLFIATMFILFKDTFFASISLIFTPFIFAKGFMADTVPIALYVAIGIAIAGGIIHFIRFKPKLAFGKLAPGLALFLLSFATGGLGNLNNDYLGLQIGLCLLIAIGFSFFYMFLVSTVKIDSFRTLAFIMSMLAVSLIMQSAIYYIDNGGFLTNKVLDLGWGITNNYAMIMLLLSPFSMYLAVFGNKKYDWLFIFLKFAISLFTFASFSRGGLFFELLFTFVMIVAAIIYKRKNPWKIVIPTIATAAIEIIILVIFSDKITGGNESIIAYYYNKFVNQGGFSTLNGRLSIYKSYLEKSMDYPIFGHGLIYPLMYSNEIGMKEYAWGHCTFIHCLFTLGIVGVLAITYHMVEKYYSVLKKINPEKMCLLLAYIMSGLYGLIDVSYFYINYVVLLLLIFVLSNDYVEEMIHIKPLNKNKTLSIR